ncbi:hypothetical protein L2E82_02362 [Cichorium intybus]|uniref:Uncharacterized protein n=1 Tax=Cichorium intybus TaxID=13427 RepID=A0ACB9H1F9_CICIN|nr:hypothetical protein L2E82_02362 [Cichorium intybus]
MRFLYICFLKPNHRLDRLLSGFCRVCLDAISLHLISCCERQQNQSKQTQRNPRSSRLPSPLAHRLKPSLAPHGEGMNTSSRKSSCRNSKQNKKETPQWAETQPQEIMLVRDDLAILLLRPVLVCAHVNQPNKQGKDASRGI